MGLWSRVAGYLRQKMSIEEWITTYGGSKKTAAGVRVSTHTALQLSTVTACVSIRSQDLAKLPPHVCQKLPNGGKRIVTNHPLERLFREPNKWQTWFEFVEMMQAAFLLRGNGYAAILEDPRGRPTGLIPLNPDRVQIFDSPDGSVFYRYTRLGFHETAVLSSLPDLIPADRIFHVKWLPVENSLYGTTRITAARESIGLGLVQQELAARLAGNGASLGGVLETAQNLTADAIKRLGDSWNQRYGGLRNAGGTAVLHSGLTWKPLGMTAVDAEFIASRRFQVEEICRYFDMPAYKVGVTDKASSGAVDQIQQQYVNDVVLADIERWEAKLSQTFGLADEGLYIEYDLDRFLRASMQVRYNAYRTGIVGMFITPNEVRRKEGMPDVEGGDTLYQPTNVAPIGFDPNGTETGPGSDVTGAPAAGGDGDPAAVPAVTDS